MNDNPIWSIIDQFISGMAPHEDRPSIIRIFYPQDASGYEIEGEGMLSNGNPVHATLTPVLDGITDAQVKGFLDSIRGQGVIPNSGMVVTSPQGFHLHISAFANAGGAMHEQVRITFPASAALELDAGPSIRAGSGTQRGVNTDITTKEGLQEAYTVVCAEFPERPGFEHEILLNIAASDWTAGYEERVMKRLTREYGLTMAHRIIATLVATPGTPRGE